MLNNIMFNLIYKITNEINKKIYIGAHSTLNIHDRYMGSGTNIKKAIKKYGRKNFTKEILFIFETRAEMFEKEKELVNEEFISRKDVYNQVLGGLNLFKKGEKMGINEAREKIIVSANDERFKTGELQHAGSRKHLIYMVHTETGEKKDFDISIFREMEQYGWQHFSKGMCRYLDCCGKSYFLKIDDPLIQTLELVAWTKNKKVMYQNNEVVWVDKSDVTDDMVSICKNTVTVKDENNNNLRVSIQDEKYLNGKYVGVNKGKKGLFDHINKNIQACIHCGLKTTAGNLSKWHNHNCKHKKN